MPGTYTYTARSAKPAHTATFTLHEGRMSVDMGAGMEDLSDSARGTRTAGHAPEAKAVISSFRLQPAMVRMAQAATMCMTSMNAPGDGLSVTARTSIGGLKRADDAQRSHVDNRRGQSLRRGLEQFKRETPDSGLPGRSTTGARGSGPDVRRSARPVAAQLPGAITVAHTPAGGLGPALKMGLQPQRDRIRQEPPSTRLTRRRRDGWFDARQPPRLPNQLRTAYTERRTQPELRTTMPLTFINWLLAFPVPRSSS